MATPFIFCHDYYIFFVTILQLFSATNIYNFPLHPWYISSPRLLPFFLILKQNLDYLYNIVLPAHPAASLHYQYTFYPLSLILMPSLVRIFSFLRIMWYKITIFLVVHLQSIHIAQKSLLLLIIQLLVCLNYHSKFSIFCKNICLIIPASGSNMLCS